MHFKPETDLGGSLDRTPRPLDMQLQSQEKEWNRNKYIDINYMKKSSNVIKFPPECEPWGGEDCLKWMIEVGWVKWLFVQSANCPEAEALHGQTGRG
jgi:hypothetical protein